ncbi:MAG: citrate transporter, partial [Nitrospiria bacterium]
MATGIVIFGIPLEFLLFGATLAAIAVFHRYSFEAALGGLVLIAAYKVAVFDLDVVAHAAHEWRLVLNLFGLLLGFAVLARWFEDSGVPEW